MKTLLQFHMSPDAGFPSCICSWCHKPIPETEVPIRLWPEDKSSEMRFHLECFEEFQNERVAYPEWGDDEEGNILPQWSKQQ